jgi:glycosyltransferase involved in cell wall biosynthesis
METARQPLVSIGVPVFNGEAGLRQCLDGLLHQDYPKLEIVISDNGSTDGTPAICAEYAARDPRIRYSRSEQNHGGPWNFNRVFELSSGTYFMWAAHDDRREPSFVRACVAGLEASPDAVLCQSHVGVWIDGHPEMLSVTRLDTVAAATGLVDRYREALKRLPATTIYGLYRASAMRQTRMWRQAVATDIAFVQEMSLYGRFVQVPAILFHYSGRASWNTIHQDVRYFLGRARKPWWYVPFVALFFDHLHRLRRAPLPVLTKLRLAVVLLAHQVTQTALKVLLKLCGAICPPARKDALGAAFFRRWLHNPNVDVIDHALFFERVCKPQLGWWR